MVQNSSLTFTVAKARLWLSWIWFFFILLLIVLIIWQISVGEIYKNWEVPCGWLSSLGLPVLTMIIAVSTVGYSSTHEKQVHSISFFLLAMFVSILYIGCLYLIMYNGLFVSSKTVEETLNNSVWFMGVFQSIVSGILAKFFLEEIPTK